MIRIIIVHEHKIFVDGIKLLVHNENILVVGEANNGHEALDMLKNIETDIIVMDFNLPVLNRVQTTQEILKRFPEIRILVLTMYNEESSIKELIDTGVSGYMVRNAGKEEFINAINCLYRGETFFSWEIVNHIIHRIQGKRDFNNGYSSDKLTNREKEVLRLIIKEFTNTEIAKELFISIHTVESHRLHLIDKLKVRNTAGLVRYAFEHNLVN